LLFVERVSSAILDRVRQGERDSLLVLLLLVGVGRSSVDRVCCTI
jgi:hypothetical protein